MIVVADVHFPSIVGMWISDILLQAILLLVIDRLIRSLGSIKDDICDFKTLSDKRLETLEFRVDDICKTLVLYQLKEDETPPKDGMSKQGMAGSKCGNGKGKGKATSNSDTDGAGGGAFTCHFCKDLKYILISDLEAHMTIHFNNTTFTCYMCSPPPSFSSLADLELHVHVHIIQDDDTVDPFECGLCGMPFLSKELLAKHMKSHKPPKTGQSSRVPASLSSSAPSVPASSSSSAGTVSSRAFSSRAVLTRAARSSASAAAVPTGVRTRELPVRAARLRNGPF